jgi:hypothetical protein
MTVTRQSAGCVGALSMLAMAASVVPAKRCNDER